MRKNVVIAICFALALLSRTLGEDAFPAAFFRADLQRTGVYKTKGVRRLSEIKWKFKTGRALSAPPAVADGIVYFGSRDAYLYALDASTGQEMWKFKTSGWVFSSPVVADEVVYVGSHDHRLYVLD